MAILVTGCAGFIGSNFIYEHLEREKDQSIIGLDLLTYAGNLENLRGVLENPSFSFIKGDVCDTETVERVFEDHQIDGVIHFAAESHVDRSIHDPQIFLKTNILGTQILIDSAKRHWYRDGHWLSGKKFLQISTDEVYGALGKNGLFTENSPLDPHSPYSASKASADFIVKAYFDTYGFPMNITRCSNNYGPYQFPEKLIPLMIRNALNHQSLPVYGDGKQIRDWLYVTDHCRAIDLVFEKGVVGEVYNIGGLNERENIDIVTTILSILQEKTGDQNINYSLIHHVSDRLGHDRRYAIDPTKIRESLGWVPSVTFEAGIRKTIQWYLEHRKWMESVISGEYLRFYEKNYGK
jgi:dTDP-glucose 4,6-dehydratase